MDETVNLVRLLKELLRREVERFCQAALARDEFLRQTIEQIRHHHWQAVFFGGTLRSLLISRLTEQELGRPRDIDIVIQGPPLELLRELFRQSIARETRFGGLQLRQASWQFDVWPLERTWALVADGVGHPAFADLPRTTFLNVEAAAIDLWPESGQERTIYSGDDRFFQGILDRVVEVNREDNPFPDLCVVRALVMASDLRFCLGPRLASYVARHGREMSPAQLEAVQVKHYGGVRVPGGTMAEWIITTIEAITRNSAGSVMLPFTGLAAQFNDDPCRGYAYLRTVMRWQQRKARHPA